MKTELTIEESARLIEVGVDPKLASKTIVTDEYNEYWENFQHPIFSFTDIFSIMPKGIKDDTLSMEWNQTHQKWEVGYGTVVWSYCSSSELILALGSLLGRVILHGYINSNTENQ